MKYIPEWVPFVDFRKVAKAGRKVSHAMRFELYELTKKRIVRWLLPRYEYIMDI